MKRELKLAAVVIFILTTISMVNAQDKYSPWVVGFGINTIDFRVHSNYLGTVAEDYVNPEEWGDNTLPAISRISVEKYLNDGFTLQLAGSLNKIKTVVKKEDSDFLYYSIDANVKYDLNNLFGQTGWFDPYVNLGGGYQSVDGKGDGVLIGGFGFNTWFNDNLGLNFQSNYKHAFQSDNRNVFQHSIGLVFKFGQKDTDGDGILDKADKCPNVVGPTENNGCPWPDTDGDGVLDKDDKCPNVAGPTENNGCPWPDTDGDGVLDKDDKCPNVAGPTENNGCPWPDTDGDGVLDKDDKCPNVVGSIENNGCPEVILPAKAEKQLKAMAKTIYFNFGKTTFKKGVSSKLDAIVSIMKQYPKANFSIDGYTDSYGRASVNKRVSEKRAKAVKDYFVSKGVSSSRLSSVGYGESNPIDTNKTRAGRANNRRVEITYKK